jgi:HAD superfamily hydrolase (TIGR01490 family)
MANMTRPAPPVAFFDVDETVVNAKTIFEFLRYRLASDGDGGERYDAICAQLNAMRSSVDRTEVNRSYYRHYAGVAWERLIAEGRQWAREFLGRPDALVPAGVDALQRHRGTGHLVVLVSGSFLPCLAPIAEVLGADRVLCTEPVIDDHGVLTGEIIAPMVGTAKAAAAETLMIERGVDPCACYAYGDHASDLPLLRSVGNPTVIGSDPVLRAAAHEAGWPVVAPDPVAFGQEGRP